MSPLISGALAAQVVVTLHLMHKNHKLRIRYDVVKTAAEFFGGYYVQNEVVNKKENSHEAV